MNIKYILDKNILSNKLIENAERRDDLCITFDVLDEGGFSKKEILEIKKSGINLLSISKKHLDKLTEVMSLHGGNLKLINLHTGKGTADVVMIAYILAELEKPETLFSGEFIIVTKDQELISVAESYGIKCIPNVSNA
jgi:hypothetical protein